MLPGAASRYAGEAGVPLERILQLAARDEAQTHFHDYEKEHGAMNIHAVNAFKHRWAGELQREPTLYIRPEDELARPIAISRKEEEEYHPHPR
jgi:hypothetical protein